MEVVLSVIEEHKFEEDVKTELGFILEDFLDFVFSKSQDYVSVDTGFLKKSASKEIDFESLEGYIIYPIYGAVLEYGSDPHAPPLSLLTPHTGGLVLWCKRKFKLNDEEALKQAKQLYWKIFWHGTEAHPFLRPAIEEGLQKFKL